MPRLSLYKPEKGLDYKFIDRQASEMFQAGGTDVYVHKYLGANTSSENATVDQPNYATNSPTNIQDLLLLENRDRKYDQDIYRIRGIYSVANIDFNLSQFGLFIDNDTVYMTVHINDFIKYVGRKPISGDVLELPHLRDDFALSDFDISLPRYYVIEDVGRASEGFSVTWFPHLYRLKLKKVTDSQQFADIFNKPANADNYAGTYSDTVQYAADQTLTFQGQLYRVLSTPPIGISPPNPTYFAVDTTLRDLLSTRNAELEINDRVVGQAEEDAAKSGYETRQFYTLAVDERGRSVLETADDITLDASSDSSGINASSTVPPPLRTGYTGYLVGDGFPSNGYAFGHGIQFPNNASRDDFFLRTDFLPSRLYKFDGNTWIKLEDGVRMNMTNQGVNSNNTIRGTWVSNTGYAKGDVVVYNDVQFVALKDNQNTPTTVTEYWRQVRQTQKTSFINNTNTNVIAGEIVQERQSLSKALRYRPEADV